MKSYFYAKSTFTAVLAFADLFNDMSVRVFDKKTGEIIGVKPVPCTLNPKEKIVSILKASNVNDVDPQVDNYLPRISINMAGMEWDQERQRGKHEKRLLNVEYDDNGKSKSMQIDINPVPYKLNFEVVVWSKYLTDGMQIIENILPSFAPELHISYKERNFGIEHKAKVTLEGITQNHVYEYGENERRVLQWNLSFSMESVLWKPMELAKDITCAIISIANVPCKKVPFEGSKINVYEPEHVGYSSIADTSPKMNISDLDQSESYDLMLKHWKYANRNMNSGKCVDDECGINPGPQPTYSPTLTVLPCLPILKKPCLKIGDTQISNYYQELVSTNNVLDVVSYVRVFDLSGADIGNVSTVPVSGWPDCWTTPSLSGGLTQGQTYCYSSYIATFDCSGRNWNVTSTTTPLCVNIDGLTPSDWEYTGNFTASKLQILNSNLPCISAGDCVPQDPGLPTFYPEQYGDICP